MVEPVDQRLRRCWLASAKACCKILGSGTQSICVPLPYSVVMWSGRKARRRRPVGGREVKAERAGGGCSARDSAALRPLTRWVAPPRVGLRPLTCRVAPPRVGLRPLTRRVAPRGVGLRPLTRRVAPCGVGLRHAPSWASVAWWWWLSRVQLCGPRDCSTPGLPVLHHLLELAETPVR